MAAREKKTIEEMLTADYYSRYSGLLALSDLSIAVVDLDGKILYEFIPTPDFCKYVCQADQHTVCPTCMEAMASEKEETFVCPRGLKNIVIPITEEDETVSYVVGCHVYSGETEYQKYMLDIPKLAQQRNLDAAFVAKTCSMLKTTEEDKIEAHRQLCIYIAQSISRTLTYGMQPAPAQSIEKDALEKRIIDLEAKNNSLMVNPHFLFNTLQTLQFQVQSGASSEESVTILEYLSDILKYALADATETISLREELLYLKKYVAIQKFRFGEKFIIYYEVDEELMDLRVFRLMLQPLVENSILHGVRYKEDRGYIKVQIFCRGGKVYFRVVDSGVGMDKAETKRLRDSMKEINVHHIGLANVNSRLKLHFGDESGIRIRSKKGMGCVMEFCLPESAVRPEQTDLKVEI